MKKILVLLLMLFVALSITACGKDDKDSVTTPEVTTPEVTTPEVTTPEVTTPEVTTPEVTTPEVTTPEVTTPEVTTPEVTTPEVTTPEVTTPEVTTPEVTTPEVNTEAILSKYTEGVKLITKNSIGYADVLQTATLEYPQDYAYTDEVTVVFAYYQVVDQELVFVSNEGVKSTGNFLVVVEFLSNADNSVVGRMVGNFTVSAGLPWV